MAVGIVAHSICRCSLELFGAIHPVLRGSGYETTVRGGCGRGTFTRKLWPTLYPKSVKKIMAFDVYIYVHVGCTFR